jgi:TonB family protein
MAFQGIRPLDINQEISVTFKLDGIDESVTAAAKIVWLTESRKGGGLRFIDLPEASRHLINNWISLQWQAGNPEESPKATTMHVEAKVLPSTPAVPLVADPSDSSPQTITIVATQPLSSSLPTGKAGPAITSNATTQAKLVVKKSLSKQHSHASADLKRSPQVPIPFAMGEKKHAWIRSYGFAVMLAASIAMMIVSGAILWPLRGVLLTHFVSDSPARMDAQPASASTAALALEQTGVVDPSSDPTIIESPQLAPIADEQENQTIPAALNAAMSAPSHPAENSAPLALQTHNGTNSKVPAFSAVDIRPPDPTIVPAKSEQSVTVTPNPISNDTNELPGTAADGKISSLSGKLPENSVSAEGSIEIIADPYPSIRVPAESKGRLSRPVTIFQIGRLVSKVEPVYPQEALRQGIAGTVKVHVVIGRSGTVERAELSDGPWLLAETVLRAVQQWRYEPTILGGEAIEVEDDITVVFRIRFPRLPQVRPAN